MEKIKTPYLVMTIHQQIPLTQLKLLRHPIISRNTKRRKREGEKLMLMTGISYCVGMIVMTTHLRCLKNLPCRMLSMAELLVTILIHTTALKFGRNSKSFIGSLPHGFYMSIHQVKTGVTRGAEEGSQISAYDTDSFFKRTLLILVRNY